MAEEPRFFVRIALYVGGAGTIYWFVSYEAAGSLLLGALAAGAIFFAIVTGVIVRAGRTNRGPEGGPVAMADRLIGFREHPEDAETGPLELEPEPIAPISIWPIWAALAFLLIGLGLLYGAWFWLPGLSLAAACAWGWTTELST
jgi:hypothetical protein